MNWDGSYLDSPNKIKNKKPTINHINENDNSCFQYAATVAVNHDKNGKNSEKISKLKLFRNRCN